MSGSSSHEVAELPGFYFDREKNRYFRILPGHNNHNPLTSKKIREKKRKSSRAKDAFKKKSRKTERNKNLVQMLNRRTIKTNENYFEFEAMRSKVQSMIDRRNIKKSKLYSPQGDILQIVPNKTYERFLFLQKQHESGGSLAFLDLTKSKKAFDIAGFLPHSASIALKTEPEILCTSMQGLPTISLFKLYPDGTRWRFFKKMLRHGTLFTCAAASNPLCRPYLSYSDGKK